MLCNKCLITMHEKNQEAGGESNDKYYHSWMMLVCPACGREVIEDYEVIVKKEGKIKSE